MVAYRGYAVWGGGTIIILALFLWFVSNGWPGSPNGCLLNTPNTCFCEAFNPLDVQNGAPGVRQKVNTWSNLYAIFTSLLVAVFVFLDRKKFAGTTPPNLLRSATAIPDVYIFAVLFLGTGAYHQASLITGMSVPHPNELCRG